MHVVVDHQAQLTAGLERHRHDVHAFVGQQTAHAGERARAVRKPQIDLGTNRHAERLSEASEQKEREGTEERSGKDAGDRPVSDADDFSASSPDLAVLTRAP